MHIIVIKCTIVYRLEREIARSYVLSVAAGAPGFVARLGTKMSVGSMIDT